jgi:CelD/BcsL family acetyltransferase involved in cellulose biosynthesis
VTSLAAAQVVLERIPYDPVAWAAVVDRHPDAEVFHGPAWLSYLGDSQGAEPVVAAVRADGRVVGYFVGGIVRRYGVRILGSPMVGWGTPRMGFLLEDGADRQAAADALVAFAFRELGCLHIELGDPGLVPQQMTRSGYAAEIGRTFVIDLDRPEEAILADMRSRTRTYIRRGVRSGLVLEQSTDETFADEYYDQLVEVFGRQGLVPTYGVERVRQLIRALRPSREVLLLRVRAPDGESVATAVVVGRNRTAVLWGAAFRRARSDLHPNEPLHWEAMREWRSRGVTRYDMGGGGDYKAQYGGTEVPSIRFLRSRYGVMGYGRSAARRLFAARQALAGHRATGTGKGSPDGPVEP